MVYLIVLFSIALGVLKITNAQVNSSCANIIRTNISGKWISKNVIQTTAEPEICVFRVTIRDSNVHTVVDFKKPKNMDVFVFDGLNCYGHQMHSLNNVAEKRLILSPPGFTVVYIDHSTTQHPGELEITWRSAEVNEERQSLRTKHTVPCEQLVERHCVGLFVDSTDARSGLCVFKMTTQIGMYIGVQVPENPAQLAYRVVSGSNCLGKTVPSEPTHGNRVGYRELGESVTVLMYMDQQRQGLGDEYVLYSEAKPNPGHVFWNTVDNSAKTIKMSSMLAESGCQDQIIETGHSVSPSSTLLPTTTTSEKPPFSSTMFSTTYASDTTADNQGRSESTKVSTDGPESVDRQSSSSGTGSTDVITQNSASVGNMASPKSNDDFNGYGSETLESAATILTAIYGKTVKPKSTGQQISVKPQKRNAKQCILIHRRSIG